MQLRRGRRQGFEPCFTHLEGALQGPSLQGSMQLALLKGLPSGARQQGWGGVVWGSEEARSFHYLSGRILAEQ